MINPFIQPDEDYGRNLDFLTDYVEIALTHMKIQFPDEDEETLIQFIREEVERTHVDPLVTTLHRENIRVRGLKQIPLSEHLDLITKVGGIVAPTLTVYRNKSDRLSLLSTYVSDNVDKRSAIKKEALSAKQKKDKLGAAIAYVGQTGVKILNNSISGSNCSAFQPLYCKSSHSAQTSTCRAATSTANLNNERMLVGNRHYFDLDTTLNAMSTVIHLNDMENMQGILDMYGMRVPTEAEVLEGIYRSTRPYYRSKPEEAVLAEYIGKLSGLQRAAVLYTGDLYHIRECNPDMARKMFDTFICMDYSGEMSIEEATGYMNLMDSDQKMFLFLKHNAVTKGTYVAKMLEEDPDAYILIGKAIKHLHETLELYRVFIQRWLAPNHTLPDMSKTPDVIRRAALVSDTDSTIFTCQNMTRWYTGSLALSHEANTLGALLSFFSSQSIIHHLAIVSGKMGVATEDLHLLAMKSEFSFPAFYTTSRGKTYVSHINACEGNIYDESETEVKGVTLKDSNVPKVLKDKLEAFMERILNSIETGVMLNGDNVLREVAEVEWSIYDSVMAGSGDYLKFIRVKDKDSYVKPMSTAYGHHDLWTNVWASKYGAAPPLPYTGVSVKVDLKSKTKMNAWIQSLPTVGLRESMARWIVNNRSNPAMGRFIVPKDILDKTGLPTEIGDAVDMRGIIANLMDGFYLNLESLGLFVKDENFTVLCMDYYPR